VQNAFVQDTGSFSQAVLMTAGTYVLNFLAAQRFYLAASQQIIQVSVDGWVVSLISPVDTNYEPVPLPEMFAGLAA